MRCNLPFSLGLSAIVCFVHGAEVWAQPNQTTTSGQSATTLARTAGEQGLENFNKQQWAEAYKYFEAAETLRPAPTNLLYMARCRRELGKLLDAARLFDRVIGQDLPSTSPRQFFDAQKSAKQELDELEKRIPTVMVVVVGAGGREVRLTIDSTVIVPITTPVKVDPGKHEAVVAWGEGQTITRTVEVIEGKKEEVRIELPAPSAPTAKPDPSALTNTSTALPSSDSIPPVATSPEGGDKTHPATRSPRVPAIALLGTGAIGLAVGAVTGSIALSKRSEVNAHCDGTSCVREYEPVAKTGTRLAVVSDVAFAVGGATALAGLIWFIAARPTQPATKAKGAWVAPVVGPGGTFLVGAF